MEILYHEVIYGSLQIFLVFLIHKMYLLYIYGQKYTFQTKNNNFALICGHSFGALDSALQKSVFGTLDSAHHKICNKPSKFSSDPNSIQIPDIRVPETFKSQKNQIPVFEWLD